MKTAYLILFITGVLNCEFTLVFLLDAFGGSKSDNMPLTLITIDDGVPRSLNTYHLYHIYYLYTKISPIWESLDDLQLQ